MTAAETILEVCRAVIGTKPTPGLIAYAGPPDPMLTQPEGEALSEFIIMVGSHKAAIRLVTGNQGGPVEVTPDMLPG